MVNSSDMLVRRALQWKKRVDDSHDKGLIDPRNIRAGDRILSFERNPNDGQDSDWSIKIGQVDSVEQKDTWYWSEPKEVVTVDCQDSVWITKTPDEQLSRIRGNTDWLFDRDRNRETKAQDWTAQAIKLSQGEYDEFMSHMGDETLRDRMKISSSLKEEVNAEPVLEPQLAKEPGSDSQFGIVEQLKGWIFQ